MKRMTEFQCAHVAAPGREEKRDEADCGCAHPEWRRDKFMMRIVDEVSREVTQRAVAFSK